MFVNKMFLFYHKDDLIPVCICCCVLFPVFLDHYGHHYLILCIFGAFLFSKVFFITKKGKCLEYVMKKKKKFSRMNKYIYITS